MTAPRSSPKTDPTLWEEGEFPRHSDIGPCATHGYPVEKKRDNRAIGLSSKEMRIFTPFRISSLVLRNRIVMPAMGTGFAKRDGSITEKLINYYRARARGGVGLIIVEETAVEARGLGYGYQLRIYEDSHLDGLGELARAVHDEGAKVFIQLAHAGRQTLPAVIKDTPVAPSPVPCLKFKHTPRELSIREIKDIEGAFVAGADKAKALGFDGVELHAAHGYLLCEFLSPLSNHRKDEYGGDLENRTRILINIIEGIKRRVGDDFPIFVKISADEYYEGGLRPQESLEIGRLLERAGVSAITVSAGNYGSFDWVVQPVQKEPGCLVHLAEAFKRELNIPVIAVGRINEPSLAEKILEEKKADLIAMGRALIADPYLLRKVQEGKANEINKCLADNQCINTLFERGREITCSVNGDLGTEKELHFR